MAYSEAMVATLRNAAPLNLAKAHDLAGQLGVSYRSVIAKAKSLGIEYEAKAPAAKKEKTGEPTKAALLAQIREALSLPDREGDLVKDELAVLLANLG